MAGVLGIAFTSAAVPESGVQTLPDRTFVHEQSRLMIQLPDGWEIPSPYRLRRQNSSSVLGFEKEDPRIAATIIWSPMGTRPWEEVIRATAEDNKGEEYATLVTVYGKDKVQRPTTMKAGPFTVYKVLIDGGPDKGDAGVLYLFEVGKGDNRWKVRIRAVYPQLNREEHMKKIEEVISKFKLLPETEKN
jgi:hypothetical protein